MESSNLKFGKLLILGRAQKIFVFGGLDSRRGGQDIFIFRGGFRGDISIKKVNFLGGH